MRTARLSRPTYYYQPRPESALNLRLPRQLDELYLEIPFFGSRKMAEVLGFNRKRMQRLMRILGIEALYPKPRTRFGFTASPRQRNSAVMRGRP